MAFSEYSVANTALLRTQCLLVKNIAFFLKFYVTRKVVRGVRACEMVTGRIFHFINKFNSTAIRLLETWIKPVFPFSFPLENVLYCLNLLNTFSMQNLVV